MCLGDVLGVFCWNVRDFLAMYRKKLRFGSFVTIKKNHCYILTTHESGFEAQKRNPRICVNFWYNLDPFWVIFGSELFGHHRYLRLHILHHTNITLLFFEWCVCFWIVFRLPGATLSLHPSKNPIRNRSRLVSIHPGQMWNRSRFWVICHSSKP